MRETHLPNTGSKQELENVRKQIARHHPPGELVRGDPHGATRGRSGRLEMFDLLAAVAIFLAVGMRPVVTTSQGYGPPKVPDFSIMANDGQTYTPDYLKGNVVLLMFWATWCPYCRRAMPHINEYADEYANAPFTILGICDGKDADAWRNYIQQHQLQWPQYLDNDQRMVRRFRAQDVPNFFLIDKDGYIVAHWVGWDDSLTDKVEKLIDHTLARPRQR